MYKVTTTPDASVEFAEIDLETDGDADIVANFEIILQLLQTAPFEVGEWRSSSVHRLFGYERILVEFVIIEDDKHVLIHSFSLLPAP